MGRAVFPPCSLAWDQTIVGLMVVMETSFKRTYASMPGLPGLLQPEPLTPQQATVYPRLCWRLLDMHRQVWLCLLWGHYSFRWGPDAHKALFASSEHLWWVWDFILNAIVPLLLSFWGFSL